MFLISGCTHTLIDFTAISTKNISGVDKSKAVQTEGEKTFHYGIGLNIKDVVNLALEEAGPEYDLMVDGVITRSFFTLILYSSETITVKGLAVKSSDLLASLGEEGYKTWFAKNSVYKKGEEVGDSMDTAALR